MDAWPGIMERLRCVPDESAVLVLLGRLRRLATKGRGPHVLAFVNAHALNLAATQPPFAQALLTSDILLRDGSGLGWLLGRCGQSPGLNMNGTDFVPRLMRACDGLPTAVQVVGPWGAEADVLRVGALLERARPWSHHRPKAVRMPGPGASSHTSAESP